jgi:hypothetical protein
MPSPQSKSTSPSTHHQALAAKYFGKAAVTFEETFEHYKIKLVAPLILFQATSPFFNAAISSKFIISSSARSISYTEKTPLGGTAYGVSKAAANLISRKIHFEKPNLIAFLFHLYGYRGKYPSHWLCDRESMHFFG